jgi:murein DD-endopeptidase MepM/ murein hydrolase activator NlpD
MLKRTRFNLFAKPTVSLVLACAVASSVLAEATLPSLVYPLMSPRVSSKFGSRTHPIFKVSRHHSGIDLAAPRGAPIRAVRDGLVVFADPYAGYGNLVVVQHENGFTSHYGHCDTIRVKISQSVSAGEIIATVGSTGNSTGPHLHFELRKDGKALDPEEYVPGLTAQAKG